MRSSRRQQPRYDRKGASYLNPVGLISGLLARIQRGSCKSFIWEAQRSIVGYKFITHVGVNQKFGQKCGVVGTITQHVSVLRAKMLMVYSVPSAVPEVEIGNSCRFGLFYSVGEFF